MPDEQEIYIARTASFAAATDCGGMMLMSLPESEFFTLNPTAAAIWLAADGYTTLRQIVVGRICAQFDVDPETARRDALEFVRQFSAAGLMQVSHAPMSAGATTANEVVVRLG
jgi:hypothetical protein